MFITRGRFPKKRIPRDGAHLKDMSTSDRALWDGVPWDRVPAAFAKRLAAQDAISGECEAYEKAAGLEGFNGVMGTGRMEAAVARIKGSLQRLVHAHEKNRDLSHGRIPGNEPSNRSASARSSDLRHLEAWLETSKTTHVPSWKRGSACWNEHRKVRRMEFRMGALPTFFRMMNPMREHSSSARQ